MVTFLTLPPVSILSYFVDYTEFSAVSSFLFFTAPYYAVFAFPSFLAVFSARYTLRKKMILTSFAAVAANSVWLFLQSEIGQPLSGLTDLFFTMSYFAAFPFF